MLPSLRLTPNRPNCLMPGAPRLAPGDRCLDDLVDAVRDLGGIDAFCQSAELPAIARELVPAITALAESMHEVVSRVRPFVAVDGLGLSSLSPEVRRAVLACYAGVVALPTETDRATRRVIWEVQPRDVPYEPTVTEHARRAELHTDSSYFKHPERFVLLYVERAARDGGASLLMDAEHLLFQLEGDPRGDETIACLKTYEYPFRVPVAFQQPGASIPEVFCAPILTDVSIRYRSDSIASALRDDSGAPARRLTTEAQLALGALEQALRLAPCMSVWLPADSLLLMDNSRCLHGRSAFEDKSRLLLRIRMTDERLEIGGSDV